MKHKLHFRRFFASLLLLAVSSLSWAYDFEVDGIYYDVNSDGTSVSVTYGKTTYFGALTIPATVINGGKTYNVTGIGVSAFSKNIELTSVIISEGVISIGDRAFGDCTGLTYIEIPSSVTSIGKRAFWGCSGLTTITIPHNVKSIGDRAFSGCSGLTSVTIGSGVTSIDKFAFYECSGLTRAEFASIESLCKISFGSYDSNPLTYAKHLYVDGKEVTDVVIPNSVTSIGNFAFYGCSGLTYATIGNSVTSIGYNAFSGCSGLTSITIPESVTSIGSYAFSGCSGLTSITISSGVTSIDMCAFYGCIGLTKAEFASIESLCGISFNNYESNPLYYAHHLYVDGKEVTNLVIPESVTTIGNFAFCNCENITSVTIGSGVTSMGSYTFSNCTNLVEVTCLAENVPTPGYAFFYNVSLSDKTLYVSSSAIDSYKAADVWKSFGNILSLKDKEAKIIAKGSCGDNVSYVLSADSVLTISGTGAMTDYSGSSSLPWYNYRNAIKSVMVENDVTSIGSYAFYWYSGLKYVTIGSGVTSIGERSFQYCLGLTFVTIPNSVASIGSFAFSDCTSLTSVTIGNSVTCIGSSAFNDCTGLTSITIPESVKSIGEGAFSGCKNLKFVTSLATSVPTSGDDIFYNVPQKNMTLYVPYSALDTYKTTDPWQNFICILSTNDKDAGIRARGTAWGGLKYVLSADSVLTISGTGGMSDRPRRPETPWCISNVNSIVIGDSVTWITCGAFSGCSELKSMKIGAGVTRIGGSQVYMDPGCAISGCTENTKVEFASIKSLCSIWFNSEYDNPLYYAKHLYIKDKEVIDLVIPSSVTSIGEYTFIGCEDIKSVTIGSGVKSIGHAAFRGCTGLNSVTIPNNVETLNLSAFNDCTGLKTLYIGSGLKSIIEGSYFQGCTGLTSIIVSKDNTKYDSRNNCNAIIESASKTVIRGFRCTVIPNNVTSIGNYAFSNCSDLTSITIPEGVTSIGNYAFSNCSDLTSITIPEGVTSIGDYAFSNCSDLTSITIPEGVTSIGRYAFSGCTSLTTVNIPHGVTIIDNNTFYGCSALTSVTIPDSVTYIGGGAFHGCSSLTSITIPDSVSSIGESAFYDCPSLKSVTCMAKKVPAMASSWGYYTSFYSLGEKTLYVPSSVVDTYKDAPGWKEFGCILPLEDKEAGIRAKGECGDNVKYVLTADSVLTISGRGAMTNYTAPWYNYRSAIKSVVVENGVTSIGDCAFQSHSSLTSVTIPEGVMSIGGGAFQECSGLTSITIPEGVTSIGNYAFSNCSDLTSITIPEGVTSIGNFAFYGCSGLTSITIPESVTSIGDYAFSDCTGLTKTEFASIKSLCTISFGSSLSNPLSCTKYLYVDGKEVTDVVIPDGVVSVGKYAFTNCFHLISVTIPNSVTSIGDEAFRGCSDLTSITIPESVTSIGNYAFSSCSGLKTVTCLAENVSVLGNSIFDNVRIESATLYVPSSSMSYYKTNNPWHSFACIFSFEDKEAGIRAKGECGDNVRFVLSMDSVLTISGEGAMTDYTRYSRKPWSYYAIKSVVVENGVTSIGKYAFTTYSHLSSVTIPSSVTSIGEGAFSNCSGLTRAEFASIESLCKISFGSYDSNPLTYAKHLYVDGKEVTDVVIPNSVTSIGNFAFYGCSGLTYATIGNSVTSIGRGAFERCDGLKSITISASVTSIDDEAFYGCTNIASVTCLVKKVPTITGMTFNFIDQATLYVPHSAVDVYKATYGWGEFGTIVGIDMPAIFIALNEKEISMYPGNQYQLTATILPEDAKQEVVWISSNTDVVTIDENGKVTAIEYGNATITATTTDGTELSATCEVTVSDVIASGSCGDNVNYILSDDHTLTISGTGTMTNYSNASDLPWYDYRSAIKSVVIEDGVTSIGSYAFYNCENLTAVSFSSNANSRSGETCTEQVPVYADGGITSIGSYAFYGCSSLPSIAIPESVTSVGTSAFQGCTSLPVEGNLRYADTYLVEAVDRTKSSYNIKEGTKWIGNSAFSNCTNLTSVIMPVSVTGVGGSAFLNCSGLSSVTIGSNVTSIGSFAFRGCISLTSVTCHAESVPRTLRLIFGNVPLSEATLYVPVSSIEMYKVAIYWRDFGTILPIDPTSVEEIEASEEKADVNTNAPIYDLNGRRLIEKPASGYYIQGGKIYLAQ